MVATNVIRPFVTVENRDDDDNGAKKGGDNHDDNNRDNCKKNMIA